MLNYAGYAGHIPKFLQILNEEKDVIFANLVNIEQSTYCMSKTIVDNAESENKPSHISIPRP